MSVRDDITIRWDLSPRLIIIDSSSLEINMQDLIDTLRTLEAQPEAIDNDYILNASGKEDLGGGVTVGLTVELQDAYIYFEQRTWVDASGTATVINSTGEYLTDSTADFITDGIDIGNIAFNTTTASMATIISIDNSTTLYTLPLTGGIRQDWQIGDGYSIYPNELCSTEGGNLVAIDASGNALYPILQAPNVQSTLTSSSSATSQNLEAIQYSSFQDGVWISTAGSSGTTYPYGTPFQPVDNLADAHVIMTEYGFDNMFFMTDWTFLATDSMSGHNIYGKGMQRTIFTFESGCILLNCDFYEAKMTGAIAGVVGMTDCYLSDLDSVGLAPSSQDIIIERCLLDGSLGVPGNYSGTLKVLDCWSNVPGSATPQFNMNDASADIMMRNYSGGIELVNASQTNNRTSIDLVSGQVKLKSSVTGGYFTIRGVGYITDDSSGAIVNIDGLMSKATVADAMLDTDLTTYSTPFTVATALQLAAYDNAVWIDPSSGNTGTVYPYGTRETPVDNLEDATIIANNLNFKTIQIPHNFTFDSSTDIEDYTIYGEGHQNSHFILESGADLHGCQFYNTDITGAGRGLDGIYNSHIHDMTFENRSTITDELVFQNTIFQGEIKFANNYTGVAQILDCWSLPDLGITRPIFDLNDASMNIELRGHQGAVLIRNSTQPTNHIGIQISGGAVLENTITAGTIKVAGVGILQDDSSGAVVNSEALMSKTTISSAVWDEPLADHLLSGTTGLSVSIAQFEGIVTIDVSNGVSGTTFPIGTSRAPVNNLTDAVIISQIRGLGEIFIEGDLTISASDNLDAYLITGSDIISTTITIEPSSQVTEAIFRNAKIQGTLSGGNVIRDCRIGELNYVNGYIFSSSLENIITLGGGTNATIVDCYRGDRFPIGVPPIIDMGGDGQQLGLRRYAGGIQIENMTGSTSKVSIDLTSGKVKLDPTCSSGNLILRGVGELIDDSSGAFIQVNEIINKTAIASGVWDAPLEDHIDASTAGNVLWNNAKKTVNKILPFLFTD